MILPRWISLRPVVPDRWQDLDAAWFTRALAPSLPGVQVAEARLVEADDGTNRRARFALTYMQGTGPERLFLKAHAPSHKWVHLRNGNLFLESRLFASGAVLPLEHPRVFLAVPDYPRLDFLLVMEDLTTRGADPRDALRPLSADQVASGLSGLAALHGAYWGMTARSHRALRWVRQWEPSQGWQVGLRRRVPIGLARAGGDVPASVRTMSSDAVVDLWAANVATLASGHQTLLHGDAHIGNTYVLADGTTGFLDWQVVRRGNWVQDVGYFLVGSLTADDRRAHERDLLAHYRGALPLPEASKPAPDDLWHRYCQSPAYGLAIWLSTLGTDGWQRREISLALAQRYATALDDLGTLAALG